MWEHKNTNSALGKKYQGLSATSRTWHSNENGTPKSPEGEAHILSAPLVPEDIPGILEILAPCPSGAYAFRVFQQHPEGLCWQDSLFIMLYNQPWFRPFLLETAKMYLVEFLNHGHTNLAYAGTKTVMRKNWSNAVPAETPYNERPEVPVEVKNLSGKITPIAALFASRYAHMDLPLTFWEYYALQLHRYILIAYLFLKYPDTASTAIAMTKSTALHSRRKSIGSNNYGELARNFKEVVFGMLDIGMYCYKFEKGKRWFETLVDEVSGHTVSLVDYTTKELPPSSILGYYIIIHSSISPVKHVVSLFKCDETWFLYDIDVGVVEFSPEVTGILNESKLDTLLIENNSAKDQFEYTLTLDDGKQVVSSLPTEVLYEYKLDKVVKKNSLVLVQGMGPKQPVKNEGGRRKTRRHRKQAKRRKHISRKQYVRPKV